MKLRFVLRNGEKVLQYGISEQLEEWKSDPNGGVIQRKVLTGYRTTWYDVPVCDESSGVELGEENDLSRSS